MPYTRSGLKFRTVVVLTVMLPLTGFITCVAWSLIFHFKSSTATHCRVSTVIYCFSNTSHNSNIWFVDTCTGSQLSPISISGNRGLFPTKIYLENSHSIAYDSQDTDYSCLLHIFHFHSCQAAQKFCAH